MWLSTRRKFRKSDDGWAAYVEFIGLPTLNEFRTIDSMLNEYVPGSDLHEAHSAVEIREAIAALPRPSTEREYQLLFLDAETEALPSDAPAARLLGHDLSDWTNTSTLLNCGRWTGELAQFTGRLNEHGLLTLEDAVRAKTILPVAWPENPHADVTVWALFELEP